MPGLAAKALLAAILLAAPGAGVSPAPPMAAPVQAAPGPPAQPLSLRALGDLALPQNEYGFIAGRQPDKVARWWAAIRAWAEARFDRLGAATAARSLAAEARRLDPDLEISVLPLGPHAMLVSANRWTHGHVFILAPRDGRVRTVWTSSAPDPAARRAFPALASWSADAVAGVGCSEEPCEAIGVDQIGALPPGPHGEARFYVHGTYFSEVGGTQGGQLAIWQWDGRRAQPLFARHFTFMIDQSEPVLTVRGGELLLHVKDHFHSFYSCGQCEGRQMAWRLRMTPDGVRDLGRTSLTPELDFMDRLAGRMLRNEAVGDMADPAPAAFFKRQVREAAGGETLVGMIGRWQATHKGSLTRLCFNADGVDGLFTLAGQGAHMRLVGARAIRYDACDRPGAHL